MPEICAKCGKPISTHGAAIGLSPPHAFPMTNRRRKILNSKKQLDPIDMEIEREMRKMDDCIQDDIKRMDQNLDMQLRMDEQELKDRMDKEMLYINLKTHPPDWDERFGLEPYYLRKMKRQLREQGISEDEIHDTAMDKLLSAGAGFVGGMAVAGGKKLFEIGKTQVGTVAAPVVKEIKKEEKQIEEKVKEEETKLGTGIAIGLRQRIPIGGFAGVGKLSSEEAGEATAEEMRRSGVSKAEVTGLLALPKSEEAQKEQQRFAKEQAGIRKSQQQENRNLSPEILSIFGKKDAPEGAVIR